MPDPTDFISFNETHPAIPPTKEGRVNMTWDKAGSKFMVHRPGLEPSPLGGQMTPAEIAELDWSGQTGVDFRVAIGAAGTAAELGLDQVDNTTDANKPVSSAQQTAIDERLMANVGLVTLSATGTTVISSVHDGMLLNVTAATHTLNFSSATGMNRVFVIGNGTSVITLTGVVDSNGNTVSTVYAPDGLVVVERVNSVWRIISAARPEVAPLRFNQLYSPSAKIHANAIASSGSNIVTNIGLGTASILEKTNAAAFAANEFKSISIGFPLGRLSTTMESELFFAFEFFGTNTDARTFIGAMVGTDPTSGLGADNCPATVVGWGIQAWTENGGADYRGRLVRRATTASAIEYGTTFNLSASTQAVWITLKTDGSIELRKVVPSLSMNLRRPIATTSTLPAVDFDNDPATRFYMSLYAGASAGGTGTCAAKLLDAKLYVNA